MRTRSIYSISLARSGINGLCRSHSHCLNVVSGRARGHGGMDVQGDVRQQRLHPHERHRHETLLLHRAGRRHRRQQQQHQLREERPDGVVPQTQRALPVCDERRRQRHVRVHREEQCWNSPRRIHSPRCSARASKAPSGRLPAF